MAEYKRDKQKRNPMALVKNLPIESYKKQLIRAFRDNDFLVVVGETGSGKTTQLPQYLHSAGYTNDGRLVGITQPRRIAAISVANRVAEETNTKIGDEVGYQVRFDDCTSDKTCIKYMTDGCLLREFLDDLKLSKYAAIILDEAHERSLDTDILFGLVKKFFVGRKRKGNPSEIHQPKVIVMSATLNHQKFAEFLGDCPVIEIPGRLHPVKEIYCDYVTVRDLGTPNYLNKVVETVMTIHLEYPPGDILVFLTGQEEIEACCDRLFHKAERIDYEYDVKSDEVDAILILPLYGSMTTDLQRKVFDPPDPSIRKVVVATNIATTSLTIEGIRYVVDSGFVKQLSYNSRTGLDSLNVVLISRSEAIQRKGRAGRTAAGTCFRMYTREVYSDSMLEETIPEIQRTSLSRVILHLKCMGINDVVRFQYIDPPEERMVLEALKQLYYFGAIDQKGRVTTLGHQMVEFPLSPGLSKTVINSFDLGCEELVLPIAAMLSVENIFAPGGGKSNSTKISRIHKGLAEAAGGTNDFATLLYIYKEAYESSSPAQWCRDHFIHWRAVKMAVSIHHQLESILERQKLKYKNPATERTSQRSWNKETRREHLRQALCTGFFCNVARRSTSGSGFRTMDGHGTTVFIHPSSTVFGCEDQLDWIIYNDIIWTSKIYVKTVCPIRYEWIKDLLPRLHDINAYTLSGWTVEEHQTEESNNLTTCSEEQNKNNENNDNTQGNKHDVATNPTKRNTNDSIEAARQRYLERKRARTSDL